MYQKYFIYLCTKRVTVSGFEKWDNWSGWAFHFYFVFGMMVALFVILIPKFAVLDENVRLSLLMNGPIFQTVHTIDPLPHVSLRHFGVQFYCCSSNFDEFPNLAVALVDFSGFPVSSLWLRWLCVEWRSGKQGKSNYPNGTSKCRCSNLIECDSFNWIVCFVHVLFVAVCLIKYDNVTETI